MASRLTDRDYRSAFFAARRRLVANDLAVVEIDQRRQSLGWSVATLARRAGVRTEDLRRLFASDHPELTRPVRTRLHRALEAPEAFGKADF